MRSPLVLAAALAVSALLHAQPPTRPAITGIAFARFYTTDDAAAQNFYGNTLGLRHLQLTGTSLYPVNASQWIEVTTATPPQPNIRMAAVAFTTRDAAALQLYLQSKNVRIEQPLSAGQFSVRDPEGNLVYFLQSHSNMLMGNLKPLPSATSQRIIHVGFIVTDHAKEDAFWQTILGFRPLWHGSHTDTAPTDWISLQVPEGSDWLEYMLNSGPNPTLQHAGVMDHFSLGTDSMPSVVAALQRNHCEGPNCTKTQMGRDGKVQLNLFDPDQTRVEYMEFKPQKDPCCSPITGKLPTSKEDE